MDKADSIVHKRHSWNRIIRFTILGLFVIFFFWYCKGTGGPEMADDLGFRNLDPSVAYVGMETCKGCHNDVHSTFIHTGMGRSFGQATADRTDATFGDHALVYDSIGDFYYFPHLRDSQLFVLEFRLEGTDTVHKRLEPIEYIVGSGQHTNSHILDINGYIFQAPVTFYTQEQKWDLAPGFEANNLRFSRLLTSECLTCHNHYPEPIEGSLNKFAEMPLGIQCERCHGPGELHVREKLAGQIIDTSKTPDYSIVNPRRLPRDLQMDLCQRCHLQGISVLKEGKDFYDFRPGMRLEEVMNVFLPRYSNSHERFIMASQADRMRMSDCYLESDMTCITCHNPHEGVTQADPAIYNETCNGCHQQQTCTAPLAEQEEAGNDCVYCHMPPSGSTDIPHVNITDHFISAQNTRHQRWQGAGAPVEGEPAFLGLEILTKEEGTPLEMAQGYLAMYDKYVQSEIILDSAEYYLSLVSEQTNRVFNTRIHYHFTRNNVPQILELARGKDPATVSDPWSRYRIGEAYFQQQDYFRAATFLYGAVDQMPLNLEFQEKLGAALVGLKRWEEAERTLSFVLQENPKRPLALTNLGFVYANQRRLKQAARLYDQALELDPDYTQALLNRAAIFLAENNSTAAREYLLRVLKKEPGNAQARQVLQQLQ
jgi:tetratricopeptide (TPR) repeat protein